MDSYTFWGFFLGCVTAALIVSIVISAWLRRICNALIALGALFEAGVNRAARNRGERPVSEDVTTRSYLE